MEVLKNIIARVNSSPKVGVAIKDNNADRWVYRMHTLDKIKQKGFNNVEDFLNHVYDLGYSDITVYLKRLNGSSSVYLDNLSYRLKSNKTTPQTKLQFQEPTPTTPPTPTPMSEQNQSFGLMGGMNQQFLNTYSKAQQFEPLSDKNNRLEAENTALKTQLETLKFENLKLEHKLEKNSEPKKPVVSDELGGMLLKVLPTIADKFTSSKTGMAGAPKVIEESYSNDKQRLLNLVKNQGFTDDYCTVIFNVCNTLFEDTESLKELVQYTKRTPINNTQQIL